MFSATESERTPLIRSYVQGLPSTYTESVGNFYSPLQSPEGSLYEIDSHTDFTLRLTRAQVRILYLILYFFHKILFICNENVFMYFILYNQFFVLNLKLKYVKFYSDNLYLSSVLNVSKIQNFNFRIYKPVDHC